MFDTRSPLSVEDPSMKGGDLEMTETVFPTIESERYFSTSDLN